MKKTKIDLDKPVYEPEYHVLANNSMLKSVAVFTDREQAQAWAKANGYTRVLKTVKEVL